VEEASSFKHTSEKLKSEFYWLLALELFQAGDWERAGDAALKSGRPNMFSLLADSSEKLALSDKKRHVVEATLSLLQAEAAKDKGGRHRDEDILRWQQTQGTHLAICRVLAYLHRYREARLWADTQLSALDRIDAHTAILSAYAREKNPQLVDFIFPRKPYSYMSD
jgi:hypothetical protein